MVFITNLNEITMGMTPQEKEIYFNHMEKRHREEAEKLEMEKEERKSYKQSLIEDILKHRPNAKYEDYEKKSIRSLEIIYDNI